MVTCSYTGLKNLIHTIDDDLRVNFEFIDKLSNFTKNIYVVNKLKHAILWQKVKYYFDILCNIVERGNSIYM